MSFANMKSVFAAMAVIAGLGFGAGQALAQGTSTGKTVTAPAQAAPNGAQFGAWTLRCVAEGVGATNCALIQRLAQAEGGAFVAEVGLNLTEVEGESRVLMILLTPDGTALNLRPAYAVDESEDQTALTWRTCAGGLCRAGALLDAGQADALRKGGRMILGYQQFGAAEPVRIAVSLVGVSDGLAALTGK